MVQVFDTKMGALRASLRAGSSNAVLSCDISNGVVVGGGSDKTCRVWNLRTQRMVSEKGFEPYAYMISLKPKMETWIFPSYSCTSHFLELTGSSIGRSFT